MSISPRILITAGPTHEPIDAVRYIANRSSGRMGIALAQAAMRRNWATTLLLGPTHLQPPHSSHLHLRRFQTAAELQSLLQQHWPQHDVLFMAAAVADYRPRAAQQDGPPLKLRREGKPLLLELEPTPDLLSTLAATTNAQQRLIGFALEPSETLIEAAQRKLTAKRLHAIVANPLETMDSSAITATILMRNGRAIAAPSNMAKVEFAEWLLEHVLPHVMAAETTPPPKEIR